MSKRETMSVDEVLAIPLIRVEERDDEIGRFIVRIGALRPRIHIELGRARSSVHTTCRMSHRMQTPSQEVLAPALRFAAPSWADALAMAIDDLTTNYQLAVSQGFKPHDWWLVER